MALLHRRKAFSVISRYRLCGRFSFSTVSSGSASSVHDISGLSSLSSSSTQMQSLRQLLPAMAMAINSSLLLSPSLVAPRSYTTVATCFGGKHTTPCCYTHKCTAKCGCLCTSTGSLYVHARNCTTTAYPPPVPPGEFEGGNDEAEADGATLNVDEAGGSAPPGAEDFNDLPPFDDSNYPEDEGDYEDADPPPDPEEKLLYSPSDED